MVCGLQHTNFLLDFFSFSFFCIYENECMSERVCMCVQRKWTICSQLNSYCYSIFTKSSIFSLGCHLLSVCVFCNTHVFFVAQGFSSDVSGECLFTVQWVPFHSLSCHANIFVGMINLPVCYFISYLNWLGGLHAKNMIFGIRGNQDSTWFGVEGGMCVLYTVYSLCYIVAAKFYTNTIILILDTIEYIRVDPRWNLWSFRKSFFSDIQL